MGTNRSTPTLSPSPSRIRRADATDAEDATAAGRPYIKCNNWGDVRIVKCDRALDDWLRDDFPNHQLCKVLGPDRALFLAAPLRLGTSLDGEDNQLMVNSYHHQGVQAAAGGAVRADGVLLRMHAILPPRRRPPATSTPIAAAVEWPGSGS
uniref:Uncharacterized protein n=1 Tax=Oryza glumipatula TaxID=40148 RepID=A0A0E0AGI7_9ORYZ